MPPDLRENMFVLIPGWLSRYDSTRLLRVPTPPVFSYYTSIYKHCSNENCRVEIIPRTENVVMTMGCFLATCQEGSASNLLDDIHIDHHHDGNLVLLLTGIMEDVEVIDS